MKTGTESDCSLLRIDLEVTESLVVVGGDDDVDCSVDETRLNMNQGSDLPDSMVRQKDW